MNTGELLRTAAQHIREYGWTVQEFGDRQQGLCLHGGLFSAALEETEAGYTADPVKNSMNAYDVMDRLFDASRSSDAYKVTANRIYGAIDVLVPLIPPCSCYGMDEVSNGSRVYHYNDAHCTGGEDAALLLEQAAEKWEADR